MSENFNEEIDAAKNEVSALENENIDASKMMAEENPAVEESKSEALDSTTDVSAESKTDSEQAEMTKPESEVGRDAKAEVEAVVDEAKKSVQVDNELLQILNAQNDVLECMLTQQKKIHDNVKDRKWVELEACIENMRAYSDAFVNLDQCRENYVGDNRDLYLEPGIQDVYASVRTKLSKSKIENNALSTYVSSTKEFIDGVIENCVPQSKTRVYGRNGRISSPMAESVVLDALV